MKNKKNSKIKKTKKRKNIDFKKEYKLSWKTLKKIRFHIFFIIGVFALFGLIGFFIQVPEEISKAILEYIQELLKMTRNMSFFELGGFIFLNNFFSSFFSLIFGVLFGIVPLVSAIANGYLVGFVSSLSVQEQGVSSLLALVPHGIFELPAVFISLGLGLGMGLKFIERKLKINSLLVRYLVLCLFTLVLPVIFVFFLSSFSNIIFQNILSVVFIILIFIIFKKDKKLLGYLKESMRVFLFVVLPLLIIAAIIETILIFLGS